MPNPTFVAKFKWFGEKKHGNVELIFDMSSRMALDTYAEKFSSTDVLKVTVSRLTKKKIRSIEQNAYYWAVVIKLLCHELGYRPGERNDLHEELKGMFLVKRGKLGSLYVERTSKLDTATFERYLQAIRDWALDFHGIRIPLPNEAEEKDSYVNI